MSRSSHYYKSGVESAVNLELMRLIDAQYLETPFYGYRRMAAFLRMNVNVVDEKRVVG